MSHDLDNSTGDMPWLMSVRSHSMGLAKKPPQGQSNDVRVQAARLNWTKMALYAQAGGSAGQGLLRKPCWQVFQRHPSEMKTRYTNELGNNAYAAFNAVTECAPRPLVARCVHRDRHSMQRLAGTWLASFNAACRNQAFHSMAIFNRWKRINKGERNSDELQR